MKAREMREALQGKVDPKILHCICELAEKISAQQQEIMALAKIQDDCINMIVQLGATTEVAVDKITKMREPQLDI
tara:strand:- start:178 stop:402 length:225 start_codon:yes stop_codon:yes gene_type:complete